MAFRNCTSRNRKRFASGSSEVAHTLQHNLDLTVQGAQIAICQAFWAITLHTKCQREVCSCQSSGQLCYATNDSFGGVMCKELLYIVWRGMLTLLVIVKSLIHSENANFLLTLWISREAEHPDACLKLSSSVLCTLTLVKSDRKCDATSSNGM